ncbi:hypothetical protein [Pseudonocardia adelaidensis]|uniref:MYXO-CTERM domain-containing protein n=1 Tax=Pseudonocardia adelaidensis TaxID=648754 RepID=A0ABP9NAR2_9PSEU
MTDPKPSKATSAQQRTPPGTSTAATPATAATPDGAATSDGAAGSAEEPARRSAVPTRLREKGAAATLRDGRTAATESVHAGATYTREFASDKAPAVKGAVQEHRGLAIGVTASAAASGYLLLRRRRGRGRRTPDPVETS